MHSETPQSATQPGELLWLPNGEPAPGKVARIHLRSQADRDLLVRTWPVERLLPALTVFDSIVAAATDPDKPAIVHINAADGSIPDRVITYADLVETITRSANLFVDISAESAVSVATILPMVPEALMATWAASASGLATPINPFLENDYIVSIMNHAKTTVLVTSPSAFARDGEQRIAEIGSRVPSIRRVLIVDSCDPSNDYATAIAQHPDTLTFTPVSNPDADVSFQLTGGTTSAPKLCRLTHRGQLINAWVNAALQGCAADSAVGHAMPNFHIGGAIVIALRTILFGQTLVTLTPDGFRNPEVITNFWQIAKRNGLTAVLATPTTAAAILGRPEDDSAGHSIHAFACGGSTVPLALVRSFHERFGVWLREQWGFSEAHGTITGHFPDGNAPVTGSIGYALPYYQVKAIEVDEDNRFLRECDAGERGVLAVKGVVTPGYVDTALNDGLFVKAMPDGAIWVNSGDLGSIDEQGYVWIFGRAKDLIVRGGHNIDPKLIEDVLNEHPAVQLAAAIGRPDAGKGEMPIAYVQLAEGKHADDEALMTFCRAHVQERAAIPIEIIIVDEMPTTPVGKISKPALRKDALVRCATGVARQIIGDRGTFDVAIDESNLRPRVMIHVQGIAEGDAILVELERAFEGFEFIAQVSTGVPS